jgi:choline transport protein
VLAQGGGVTTIFCLILAGLLQWVVFLGLGELCSAFPSSGGQYHFTYVFAPDSTRSFAAYTTGFINILAWWINTSSGIMYTAISAFGCAAYWFPEFAREPYEVYLVYLGVIFLSREFITKSYLQLIDSLTDRALSCSHPDIPGSAKTP